MGLAVLGCCPMVSLLGSVMGLAALGRIRHSRGELRGRRLALAATFVGAALAIGSSIGLGLLQESMRDYCERSIAATVEAAVHDAADGKIKEAGDRWGDWPGDRPNDEALARLGNETLSRYGGLKRFQVTHMVPAGGFLNPQFEVAGVFDFERGQQTGSARAAFGQGADGELASFWLRQLKIDDAQAGSIEARSP